MSDDYHTIRRVPFTRGDVLDELNTVTAREMFHTLTTGDPIGAGVGRIVFPFALMPEDFVVKIEMGSGSFQNVAEWQAWDWLQYDGRARPWFAPCRYISPTGVVMIQERTQPIAIAELPDRLPNWFTDTKADNWGMLHGRPVCHDYGMHRLLSTGVSSRTKKAVWR